MSSVVHLLVTFGRAGLLTGARLLSLDQVKPYRSRRVVDALTGSASVNGKQVTLVIGVTPRFPLELPPIFLCPHDALGVIPHVMWDGYVCYADGEGLVLDAQNPAGVLTWALNKALRTLEDGATGKNSGDFIDEFRSYWSLAMNSTETLRSLIEPDNEVRRLVLLKDTSGTLWVMDEEQQLERYQRGVQDSRKMVTAKSALFVPLRADAVVLPPLPDHPWTIEHIRRLVQENLSPENMILLKEYGYRCKWEELVVLSIPRPGGSVALCGLKFRNVRGTHPLLGGAFENPPRLIDIQRMDRSYLVPRGGASLSLSNAHVLLVGCGAVGGHIAMALPQLGVGKLSLVDPDTLQPENVFRHVLGRSGLGLYKVEALKLDVERKYPYVSVTPHRKYIDEAVARGTIQLADYDLVIFATGAPTIELHLNKLIHQAGAKPPAVFTWLEPLGIGGHALLTRPGTPGCLECLYADPEKPLHNCASFAADGQTFSRDDLGCGSRYTPFGGLDAIRTAELACRLALDALLGFEEGNPILSWRGPERQFVGAGFGPSERHLLSSDDLHERRYAYIRPGCPTCGGAGR